MVHQPEPQSLLICEETIQTMETQPLTLSPTGYEVDLETPLLGSKTPSNLSNIARLGLH